MTGPASALLEAWLRERLSAEDWRWLDHCADRARTAGAKAQFFMAFGSIPRRLGRKNLDLSESEHAAAHQARTGWQPGTWTVEQAARSLLVLSLPAGSDDYERWLGALFDDAELGELVALYQTVPLLPHPAMHRERAKEGIRTNMKAVFEAIALSNPYPSEQLPEEAFNQLVLKCLFIESSLHRVYGIDERTNVTLARMLCDYAQERWAAGRSVSPELWRCVGPVAQGPLLEILSRVLSQGTPREKLAVALACRTNPDATALRAEHRHVFEHLEREGPTWSTLSTHTS